MRIVSAFWVVLVAFGFASAENWPSFRGPHASGIGDGQNPPAEWNIETGRNVEWKAPIPGLGHSSPIVWGDRVFLTTAVSENPDSIFVHGLDGRIDRRTDLAPHRWYLLAVHKETGEILWQRLAHEGKPRVQRHPKNSYASATPATDGRHVVAILGAEGLFCYDIEGNLLWKRDLGAIDAGASYDDSYDWGPASSPILFKGRVIVLADAQHGSFLAAFDVATGEELWRTERDVISSFSTPTIHEGKDRAEVIINGAEWMHGYDPATGKELWRLFGSSKNTTPTPVVSGGLAFITSGYRIRPIFAVRPGASGDISLGDGETSNDWVAWSASQDGSYMTTPLVYRGYLYILKNNGVLSCFRAETGERLYQRRVADRGGAYSASPVAADGRLYLASEDGEIHVLAAGPEYRLLSTNVMGEVLMATPAISEGRLLVRTQHHLYSLSEKR